MKLFSDEAKEIFRTYSDQDLEEFLGVDLQVIWENSGESEENYEEEVLEMIELALFESEGN